MKFAPLKLLANPLTSKKAGANLSAERIMPYIVEGLGVGAPTHASLSPSRRHDDQIKHVFKLTPKLTLTLTMHGSCEHIINIRIDFEISAECIRCEVCAEKIN